MDAVAYADIYSGQLLMFRSYEDVFEEYQDLQDGDGDFSFGHGFVFKQDTQILAGYLCRVVDKCSGTVVVDPIDTSLNNFVGSREFVPQLFTKPQQTFKLTCDINTTVDDIYIFEDMNTLLKNVGNSKEVCVDDKSYYKIGGYYFPKASVTIEQRN